MKKGTVNTLLIVGAAAAAFFLFTAMRRRRGTTVEAGPTEIITQEEFEQAEVFDTAPTVKPMAILDVIKSLKRTPEQKQAQKQKRAEKKQARTEKRALKKQKAIKGMDDVTVIY